MEVGRSTIFLVEPKRKLVVDCRFATKFPSAPARKFPIEGFCVEVVDYFVFDDRGYLRAVSGAKYRLKSVRFGRPLNSHPMGLATSTNAKVLGSSKL
jgi:hypothetical protein